MFHHSRTPCHHALSPAPWLTTHSACISARYVWYDQLESGQDNLVLSTCPSSRSPECWNETLHAKAISSVDLMSFLYREFVSYEKFNAAWAETARADSARDKHLAEDLLAEAVWAHDEAENVRSAVNEHLWVAEDDVYTAANLTKAAAGFQRVVSNKNCGCFCNGELVNDVAVVLPRCVRPTL